MGNVSDFNDAVDNAIANSNTSENKGNLSWKKHGIFLLRVKATEFLSGPIVRKPKTKDSRFKFIAEQIIAALPGVSDESVTKMSKELLSQHRTIEDTEARRRLEKWACRIILWYLVFVFMLILLNGASRIIWDEIFKEAGFISDTVMYAILSTTTVNIIGLGFIVLKGHFPQKKSDKGNSDSNP